jgi:hypothetical protein
VQAVSLWALLARRLPSSVGQGVLDSALRAAAASVGAVVVGRLVASTLRPDGDADALSRALPGLFGAIAFGFAFLVGAALLRSPELITLAHEFRKRLAKRAGKNP